MADPLPKDALDSAVKPSHVARQKFDLERRGFDQSQVRTYLIAVADALRDAQDRETEIRARLGKAIRRAEKAEANPRTQVSEDPSALTRQLGEEVAGVLDAARVAGEQKIAAAEKSAEQLLRNAKTEGTDIRRAAETIMDERRAEADAAADEIMAACKAEADEIVATARKDAATMRSDAAADVERARNEGDALIGEAEAARIQILQDMDRRRRQARAQVERLRVGRDRLLRSYDVVRRTLDESTGELKGSLREAKVLGDTAARGVASQSLSTPHQLEAEMADAKLLARPVERDTKRPKSEAKSSEPSSPSPDAGTRKATGGANDSGGGAPASKTTSAPGSAGGFSAQVGAGGTHGTAASRTKPAVQVPHVDMTTAPRGLSGDVAPSPRRPAVADSSVPRPPATAPTIKAPAAQVETTGDRTAAHAVGDTIEPAEPVEAIEASETASIDLPVPTLTLERPVELVDDAAHETAEVTAEALTADADEDFSDLPTEELAIIEASDDIEEVVALVPEKLELGDAEITTWVPADTATTTEPAKAESVPAAKAETSAAASSPATAEANKAEPAKAKKSPKAKKGNKAKSPKAKGNKAAATPSKIAKSSKAASSKTAKPSKASKPRAGGDEAASGLFAQLRREADPVSDAASELIDSTALEVAAATEMAVESSAPAEVNEEAAEDTSTPTDTVAAMAQQRDAVVAAVTADLTKRLKRALADEQNDVLAGIRAAGKKPVELIGLVGETDAHVQRYVSAIVQVAATAYGAGAALLDRSASDGEMPAGAVEEVLGSAVVLPVRLRLLELDAMSADSSSVHIDAIRAFYRQRKTDHLGEAASTVASLLVTAGACDALADGESLPWLVEITAH